MLGLDWLRPDGEIDPLDLREVTAEEEVYDWMSESPVPPRERPEWLPQDAPWTPTPVATRRVRPASTRRSGALGGPIPWTPLVAGACLLAGSTFLGGITGLALVLAWM